MAIGTATKKGQKIQKLEAEKNQSGRNFHLVGPTSNKKAQLSLTNPRDACEKFARFT